MIKNKLLPENLQNMVPLVFKLLKTFNPIVFFQLGMYLCSILCAPFDCLISLFHGASVNITKQRTIFLSGYSRSGTTMIYQTLVACLPGIEYINNLVILFPRSYPIVSGWYRKFISKRDLGLVNYYGRTLGVYGTNDGAQLMESFFGPKCFVTPGLKHKNRITRFFNSHYKFLQTELLFKNCNLYLKFPELQKLYPNSIFIFVKREPKATCLSTLKARRFIQGTTDCAWEYSISRSNGENKHPIDEVMSNIKYAYQIVENMDCRNLITIDYEEFCKKPFTFIQRVASVSGQEIDYSELYSVKQYIRAPIPFKAFSEVEEHIVAAHKYCFGSSEKI